MPNARVGSILVGCAAFLVACAATTDIAPRWAAPSEFAQNSATTGVTVTSTSPSNGARATTLDVQVNGSGFDKGSAATFLLQGVLDNRVHVNTTRYSSSSQLIANVTIAGDAVIAYYDVAVATASGKKGIGTELFVVSLQAQVMVGGAHVVAVNELGDVVGNGPSTASCSSQILPLLWRTDGSKVALPLGTFCGGNAMAINNSGVVLGSLAGGASNARGLWIPNGGAYSLQEVQPAPDGYRPITGGALNDANEIFGWGQGGARLYWWSSATGWLPVQVPPGATFCQTRQAINNLGELAANCTVGGIQNAYYWADHSATPTLLPRTNATGTAIPSDMNDAGVIVGSITGTPGGAVRWNPGPSGYTVEILPNGSGLGAGAIASDGTIVGSLPQGSKGPLPVMWSPGEATYKVLGLPNNGGWGEALDVASGGSAGLTVGGSQSNQTAVRWRYPGR